MLRFWFERTFVQKIRALFLMKLTEDYTVTWRAVCQSELKKSVQRTKPQISVLEEVNNSSIYDNISVFFRKNHNITLLQICFSFNWKLKSTTIKYNQEF